MLRRADELLAALRDHTAVVRLDATRRARAGPRRRAPLARAASSPRTAGAGSPPGCARCRSRTARRCAAAAGCAPATPIVLVAEMEPLDARPPRASAAAALLRARRLPEGRSRARRRTRSRTSARRALAGATPPPVPLELVVRRVGREAEREMPAARAGATVGRRDLRASTASHVPPARRRSHSADRAAGRTALAPLASASPSALLPPHGVITAYHHPGFAAPIGDHVMPMRKFQLVADALAGRAGRARRGAGSRSRRRRCCRVHTARLRRRGAHAASRARSRSRRSSRGRRRSGRRCC